VNGVRWTTGIGIAVGGVGGALAALMGTPKAPAPPIPQKAQGVAKALSATKPAPEVLSAMEAVLDAASASAAAAPAPPPSAATAGAAPATSAAAPEPAAAEPLAIGSAPPLDLPTTRDALLRAEMLCDQKKAFDECERAAQALEKGTTGDADLEQAKRFRRIALTHLVAQCEEGSPHPCFVLAAKYRAGTELAAKPASADALEKRGLELCRKRSAPECPAQ
jgi:hypothetical protein